MTGWKRYRKRVVARARLVLPASAVGVTLGALGVTLTFAVWGDLRLASEQVFAVGGLALSMGIVGWSGSILFGPTIERLRSYDVLRISDEWTEAASRRAMARLSAVGAGTMIGTTVTTLLFGGV